MADLQAFKPPSSSGLERPGARSLAEQQPHTGLRPIHIGNLTNGCLCYSIFIALRRCIPGTCDRFFRGLPKNICLSAIHRWLAAVQIHVPSLTPQKTCIYEFERSNTLGLVRAVWYNHGLISHVFSVEIGCRATEPQLYVFQNWYAISSQSF